MAKRRQPWKSVYDGIRIIRNPRDVIVPPATETELDDVEAQLGSKLPHSYREFMKRFGPGELMGWVALDSLVKHRKGTLSTVSGRTTALRIAYQKHPSLRPNHLWLGTLVYFASSGGNDQFAWDPAAKTNSRPHDCQFYCLPRMREHQPIPAGDAFWKFVEWVEADVRSWREPDPDDLKADQPGISFSPAYLRSKKSPPKRDVNLWLACNNGTVRDLAQSIRDGKTDALPLLADALEDAGCTHVDLLHSCRSGDPEIDGNWVLQVLLGKG